MDYTPVTGAPLADNPHCPGLSVGATKNHSSSPATIIITKDTDNKQTTTINSITNSLIRNLVTTHRNIYRR